MDIIDTLPLQSITYIVAVARVDEPRSGWRSHPNVIFPLQSLSRLIDFFVLFCFRHYWLYDNMTFLSYKGN